MNTDRSNTTLYIETKYINWHRVNPSHRTPANQDYNNTNKTH